MNINDVLVVEIHYDLHKCGKSSHNWDTVKTVAQK